MLRGANVHWAFQNVTPVRQWRSQDFIFDSKEVDSHPMFWSIFLKTVQKREKKLATVNWYMHM